MHLFPYEQKRPFQDVLLDHIDAAVKNRTNLVAHAPTGLGKTAASLAGTLSNTLQTNKTVVFVTSMHTQHQIALDTVKEIRQEHGVKVIGVDVLGKKHLCLQPGVRSLPTAEFTEYCRALREDDACEYYSNLRKGENLSSRTKQSLKELKRRSPVDREELIKSGSTHDVCPYEVSLILGKESDIIITDYYYLFHPGIRDTFLAKIGKTLEDLVIIVDEAHNLPDRVKDLASHTLSTYTLEQARREAGDYGYSDLQPVFNDIAELLKRTSSNQEQYVSRAQIVKQVDRIWEYDALITTLEDVADEIREEEKTSAIGRFGSFLESWQDTAEGYTHIIQREKNNITLKKACLDASQITRHVFEEAISTTLMSGTLTPPAMYRDIMGLDSQDTEVLQLTSPFPKENRLNLIVPKTSTKYKKRSEKMYREIGETVSQMANRIPGNVAVFFPSYTIVKKVKSKMRGCKKTVFSEQRGMSTEGKKDMLDSFKQYKDIGAVLLGVTRGSFAEGIDLPGDLLKGVIIVGLPLGRPDLETKALIDYYDKRFGKGWDYGYIYPAFNKTLQGAGRCIRSGDDKGVIIFLDERYAWDRYRSKFPKTWNMKVSALYNRYLDRFFGEQ